MTVDEAIACLNDTVKCTLKPSQIHGIGVFALRDIQKGENLGCVSQAERMMFSIPLEHLNKLRPEVLALILDRWPQPQPFLSPNDEVHMMSFMNHSATPNSQENIAIRDIKAGEEVTEDYRTGNLTQIQKQHYSFL